MLLKAFGKTSNYYHYEKRKRNPLVAWSNSPQVIYMIVIVMFFEPLYQSKHALNHLIDFPIIEIDESPNSRIPFR